MPSTIFHETSECALPHIGAWNEAFRVTESSPMYVAPENRVSIW
ncbi:MAG: hypothetical protein PUD89_02420 [Bacteroidales bacterium]|nr:hypothetical protein [Bacteroidales bacterium]